MACSPMIRPSGIGLALLVLSTPAACVDLGPYVGVRAGFNAECQRVAVVWSDKGGALESTEVLCSSVAAEQGDSVGEACRFELAPPARCSSIGDVDLAEGLDVADGTGGVDAGDDAGPGAEVDGTADLPGELDGSGPDADAMDSVEATSCSGDGDCADLAGECASAACDGGQCVVTPLNEGGFCDDGDGCTTGDTCGAGSCQGVALNCVPSGPCVESSVCNPQVGACEEVFKADGSDCDDGDACTTQHECVTGVCVGSQKPTDDGDWFQQITGDGQVTVQAVLALPQDRVGIIGEFSSTSVFLGYSVGGIVETLALPAGAAEAVFEVQYDATGLVVAKRLVAWSDLSVDARGGADSRFESIVVAGSWLGTLYYGDPTNPKERVAQGTDVGVWILKGNNGMTSGIVAGPVEPILTVALLDQRTFLSGYLPGGNVVFDSGFGTTPTTTPTSDTFVLALGGTTPNFALPFGPFGIVTGFAWHESTQQFSVAGLFESTLELAPGKVLTSLGETDHFVARYTETGELIWARGIGAAGCANETAVVLAAIPGGGVLAAGRICAKSLVYQTDGSIEAIPGQGGLQDKEGSCFSTVRLSAAGLPLSSVYVESPESEVFHVRRFASSSSGRMFGAGFASGAPVLPGINGLELGEQAFISEFSASGEPLWTAGLQAGDLDYSYWSGDLLIGLAPFDSGVVVGLNFSQDLVAGGYAIETFTPTNGSRDALVFKVNTGGGLSCP